jgi:putative membrane protein
MPGFVLRWAINAAAIYLTAQLLPGVRVPGVGAAVVAALVLGVVNAVIRPLVFVLTLPLTILTLGLFTLVVNGLMLSLVAMVTALQVTSFWWALAGALVISLISMTLSALLIR